MACRSTFIVASSTADGARGWDPRRLQMSIQRKVRRRESSFTSIELDEGVVQ